MSHLRLKIEKRVSQKIMSLTFLEYMTDIWYVGDWHPQRYTSYNRYVQDYEKRLGQKYPLGEDTFKIDHGKNYFNFFRRLGEPFYYVIFKDQKVVGTICYVYRKIGSEHVMYLCDLKFDPVVRGTGLMTKVMYRTVPTCLLRTNKFYAISMNDTENSPNRIMSMGKGMGQRYGIDIESGGTLYLYSLDYDQMCFVHDLVEWHKTSIRGVDKTISYVSLKGIKDLVITSNDESTYVMKLLHVSYIDAKNTSSDTNGTSFSTPLIGYTHMFCTHKNSELVQDLKQFNILPSSTAQIIHYNMDQFDWEIIQTCDI